MTYYQDNHVTIYNQNFLANELESESIQCVVTSPPYWGLRKYSGDQDLIWGDNHCEHDFTIPTPPRRSRTENDCPNQSTISAGSKGSYYNAEGGNYCSLCGAWRGSYGLEPTIEMYVQHTVEILREVKRVLRKDGVCFLNLGDSYYSSPSNQQGKGNDSSGVGVRGCQPVGRVVLPRHDTIKPKDLCLIPFRVAISAQEDGWWVRSVIIWSKPNPMPESVKDRPTESHEYILMLTKSAKYYWDADAVRREYTEPLNRWGGPEFRDSSHKYIELGGHDGNQKYGATSMFRKGRPVRPNPDGANIRSVWEFPPLNPNPEAHFAVFPEKLPETCIKAASKPDDIILDPFMGAGTTLWVAKKLNRKAIGFDISEEYCRLAVDRNRQQVMI